MKQFCIALSMVLCLSCKEKPVNLDAQSIVDKAILIAGGDRYDHAEMDFTFRNIKYKSIRQNGTFSLQRFLPDTLNTIDILTNDGFIRLQKSEKIPLADSIAFKYMESVNSVHYFVQLPFGLNNPAVYKKLLGESTIKNKNYYKIEVTFSEEGGGVDFEDVFLYWISKDGFTLDYLAYQFYTGKGGIRFRESYNPRVIEGIRFVDYNNYRPKDTLANLYEMDVLFEANALELLSKIETENVSVRLLK
ncbi:MAG: deoxyribose-phosphate aldolase [Bacteroidetes bacterium HGW-Bacteroidetes-2]|jgi:hypothetical protein|nr:MAG: deoxyribose-phosphate aldolase [Bacteroidetes bacterium HGW-Bacteroidetes-2]